MKTVSTKLFLLLFGLSFVFAAPAQTPIPAATPTPAVVTTQDKNYLTSRIAMTLADPLLRRGQVGVKVVSASTGETVYERNAENYFMPASNMKSFTVAAALEKLSPGFRFATTFYSISKPDANGALAGDLIIYGRGDPSFSEAFDEGAPYRRFDAIAESLYAAGVRSVNGSLVADQSYFNTNAIPLGWEWDDLQWYYGAEVSALSAFDNTITLKVLPSTEGSQCVVQMTPFNSIFKIINHTRTGARGEKRSLRVTKLLGQNVIELSGVVASDDSGFSGEVAVSNPAELFADVLVQRLRLRGITVSGGTRVVDYEDRAGVRFPAENYVELARSESPALAVIAEKTMKPSQNLYTELILRALGEATRRADDNGSTSDKNGADAVQELLRLAGVEARSVVQYDGSGLSRHNLITPDSAVKLYQYMDKSRNNAVWRNSLTIGGVDGTLRNRFKGTAAQGNVRGKTGTLDQVSALSGYVTSKSGERFVFSVLTNNIPDSRLRTSTIDSIVLLLSDFDGKL